jgi:cytochrome c553
VKKFLKWTGFVVAGLVGVLLLGIVWMYVASERAIARTFTAVDNAALVVPTDAESIAEGERIARLAGCQHCHGDALAGQLVDDIPNLVRLVAANASVALPEYSDQQIATLLRKGVKADGTSLLFMPSEMFRHLSDADLARIIAWLRTVPATPAGVQEETDVRLLARMLLAKGDLQVSAAAIQQMPPGIGGFDASDPVSHGKYLAMNFCTECHGQNLEGFDILGAPPLAVVKGYTLEQFAHLMKHGVPIGGRELRIMGPTSRARFARFTEEEVSALHAFLTGG